MIADDRTKQISTRINNCMAVFRLSTEWNFSSQIKLNNQRRNTHM